MAGILSAPAYAEGAFKKDNPDPGKYEFARSYISALSYFYAIDQRWTQNPPKKKFAGQDLKIIRRSMEYLVWDNADLRIAKNYMVKYLYVPNALMRKASDMMIAACYRDIALNNQEKRLWQDWLDKKFLRLAINQDERAFIKAQEALEHKRKESDKSIIEASILMTRVLLSQDNPDEKGHRLAITSKERNQLVDHLDRFGRLVSDWGLKDGQTTLEASIAVIREVLEDSVWISHK